MRKNMVLLLFTLGMAGCSVNKQAQQIKALKDCQYKITSVDGASLAGTDIKKLFDNGNFNLGNLPGVALGLLRKDIPLSATVNLEITNPSGVTAAINQFDYKILVNNTDLAEGTVNQNINIVQGQKTVVPISIRSNVYKLLTNQEILNDVMKAAKKTSGRDESLGLLTIKIRPTFMIGNTPIKYPGYISISKEVSSKILL
ncbi:MAG: LEA type 2 family protein [Pedobacter sp.]|nr:LEA type 2 family protein [Pedobacter sp.]